MIGHLIHGKRTKPEEMTQLQESLRNEMVAAQLRQKEYYDLHRKPDPNLQLGDMVWLLPRNIKTTSHQEIEKTKRRPRPRLATGDGSEPRRGVGPTTTTSSTEGANGPRRPHELGALF